MSGPKITEALRKNHLLSLLPEDECQSLAPLLTPVKNDFKEVLYYKADPISYVYFPCTSVFSILVMMSDGSAVEVGTVGNEGLSAIDVLMGGDFATHITICQIPGDALRMKTVDFKAAMATHAAFRAITRRYLQAYVSHVSQSVACNRLHTIEARFARSVLLTHDRVAGDEFQLTQEFLADMLGVRRPSVSMVASAFQQAGMIKYTRGKITILGRERLEQVSCECYENVKRNFEALLGRAKG